MLIGWVAKAASLAPWFPSHLQRNIYLSLLHHEQTNPETGKPVQVPNSVIKAALLRRAMEDINRIIQMRNAKQALATLLQRGSVGDDLWQRFQRAEKELEAELEDVVHEVRLQTLPSGYIHEHSLLTNIGKCFGAQLGSAHLPVR